jgi:hypothetical protein
MTTADVTILPDWSLLELLEKAERSEAACARAARVCGTRGLADLHAQATETADQIRAEVARRLVSAAETMLDGG